MSAGAALDCVVVGAGAAGLAATRRLQDHGLAVRCLEARDRIGGRAWSDRETFGHVFDRGCAWLHCAPVNPWVPIARDFGFHVWERSAVWRSRAGHAALSDAEFADAGATIDRFFEAIAAIGAEGRDVAAIEAVDRESRWYPLFRAIIGWVTGAELEQLSTLDMARGNSVEGDWPIEEGYGSLVQRYGRDLAVTLNCPVSAIDWSAKGGVKLATPLGEIAARSCVLAVPSALIAAEAMTFSPALPRKIEAATALPLGADNKIVFEVLGDPFGFEPLHCATGALGERFSSIEVMPFGRPLAILFLGGALADELERAGTEASIAFGRETLIQSFGSDIANHLRRATTTAWRSDPWSRGAYSAAKPGQADARARLAEPVEDRLFFCGEACSATDFATCHGAYMTGLEAADAVAKALKRRRD